ncbi:hypothetical protein ACS0TY_024192 [Phlomoides rotata]
MIMNILNKRCRNKRKRGVRYSMIDRMPSQGVNMGRLIWGHQIDCYDNLRMDRNAFGGLVDRKHVSVKEQVAMFLSILAHHKKYRVVKFNHHRSGQTVSHYVHAVLLTILKMHYVLFIRPEPVPSDSTNPRWKWFNGCLGAIDGTYKSVHIPEADKAAACDRNCMLTYILPGWEGSALDARVLRDSISRVHSLKVHVVFLLLFNASKYYLCDNGYTNSPGFLSSYRSVRYHLSEWGPQSIRPQTYQNTLTCVTHAHGMLYSVYSVSLKCGGVYIDLHHSTLSRHK